MNVFPIGSLNCLWYNHLFSFFCQFYIESVRATGQKSIGSSSTFSIFLYCLAIFVMFLKWMYAAVSWVFQEQKRMLSMPIRNIIVLFCKLDIFNKIPGLLEPNHINKSIYFYRNWLLYRKSFIITVIAWNLFTWQMIWWCGSCSVSAAVPLSTTTVPSLQMRKHVCCVCTMFCFGFVLSLTFTFKIHIQSINPLQSSSNKRVTAASVSVFIGLKYIQNILRLCLWESIKNLAWQSFNINH